MSIGKFKDLLRYRGFQPFLWTQFLGALNDSIYIMVVSLLAVGAHAGSREGSTYLSLAGFVFNLPFFLFSGYAGHLADVFSKRKVLIIVKFFEIVAMSLAFLAFFSNRIELMLGILFLMALQSTFFSPAKYGILPEMLHDKDLSRANGLLEMTTFLAIILGTSIGGLLCEFWKDQLGLIGLLLITIAVVGALTSLGIAKVPASGARKPFRLNPWAEIHIGIRHLYSNKALWLTVLGISYFMFLGQLLKMDMVLFGKEVMSLNDFWSGILLAFLAVGIGVGSIVAGRLSGDKVEFGLVPLGSIGLGIFSLLLSSCTGYYQTAMALTLLAFSGGLFIVPLNAFLQQKSGRQEKGRLIASSNFLSTGGLLLSAIVLWVFHAKFHISADQIILIFGVATLLGTVYVLKILPDFLIRFTLWMLTHTIYKIRIVGQEHIPLRGPALLVCNHMSQVDGLLVGACIQRFIRFLVYQGYYELRAFNWFFRLINAIPISDKNPRTVIKALQRARKELQEGHVVCIFAEGAISRTGGLLPFKKGFERIVDRLDVPVIPVHLDRLWGSIFSFKEGHFLWKWPRRIPYPVTVSFGQPLASTATTQEVRQAIMELGSDAVQYRRTCGDLLHLRFIQTAKRHWFSFCMADSTGKELTYGKALVASLLLARWFRKQCPNDSMIGLLLPASIGGALANIAVLLAGKIPVNINFTAGREAMASAAEQCGIRTTLTSRTFIAKAKLQAMKETVLLEEVMKEITPLQKPCISIVAFLLPSCLLRILYNREKHGPDSLATVIFSSGTTGIPKGVMLSHHNILSNTEGFGQLFSLGKRDRMMGVLPFFHAFGFTGTLWFPILSGFGAVYHPNPLDAKTIGEMTLKYKAALLISTPSFFAAYLRKCSAEQFSSLRYAIVGAEKLREHVARDFKEKYGLELLEGYGCTETGPAVSVNIPDVEHGDLYQTGIKPGTVGRPIPGVAVKVVDPETGERLPYNQEGLLLVKGPSRMMGYLGRPEKTREVLRDDWYVTGDIALIDDDGFIQITDRLSRFSKIAGEMVPHIKIEDAINRILGEDACVVTAVADEQKGERLVALYTQREIKPEDLWKQLTQSELPKLWIPKREDFYQIDEIPTLGTGKVDLRQVKAIAADLRREA